MVTGCSLAVVLAFMAAGVAPVHSGLERAAQADLEYNLPDAQFAHYLEYRARLETSSNCP